MVGSSTRTFVEPHPTDVRARTILEFLHCLLEWNPLRQPGTTKCFVANFMENNIVTPRILTIPFHGGVCHGFVWSRCLLCCMLPVWRKSLDLVMMFFRSAPFWTAEGFGSCTVLLDSLLACGGERFTISFPVAPEVRMNWKDGSSGLLESHFACEKKRKWSLCWITWWWTKVWVSILLLGRLLLLSR